MQHVRITIDDEAQLTVTGAGLDVVQRAESINQARAVAMAAIADRAESVGRPLLVEATSPGGSHWLKVDEHRNIQPATRSLDVVSSQASGSPATASLVSVEHEPTADGAMTDDFDLVAAFEGVAARPSSGDPVDRAGSSALEEARAEIQQTERRAEVRKARKQRRGLRGRLRRGASRLESAEERAEQAAKDAEDEIRAGLSGKRIFTVLGTKGGAGKTPAAILLGCTVGTVRGGGVVVVCLNPAQGTLGERGIPAAHARTVADLLEDLDRFETGRGTAGDLDAYVWPQPGHFDILPSETREVHRNPRTAHDVKRLLDVLTRYYRVVVIDTGNDMGTGLWQECATAADRLLLVSRLGEDQTKILADMAAALDETGHSRALAEAVTVLMPGEADAAREATADSAAAHRRAEESARLHRAAHEHFSALTASVIHAPFEPAIANGRRFRFEALSTATRQTWTQVARDLIAGGPT